MEKERNEGKNMKKIAVLVVCLCFICSAAFAENVIELKWADIGTEDVQAAGTLQKIENPGEPTVVYWIPNSMGSVDVSAIEGQFKPTALYTTEDQACSVAIFVVNGLAADAYAKIIETEGGGTNFRNVKINGVDCIAYEVEDTENSMDSIIYPVTDTLLFNFNCNPLNGDENWDAVKGVIFASIQIAE